jgi:hypothetical protein
MPNGHGSGNSRAGGGGAARVLLQRWRGSGGEGRTGGPGEEGRGLAPGKRDPFKGRQFTAEVILWAVRWYLRFPISYRDLECMLADRGVSVDHTTPFRWIQVYAPELDRRLRPHLRPTTGSWRVDETYIRVKGRWTYLYRAVDARGQTIDWICCIARKFHNV